MARIEDYGFKTGDVVDVHPKVPTTSTLDPFRGIVTMHDGTAWVNRNDDGHEYALGIMMSVGYDVALVTRPTPDPLASVLDDPELRYAFVKDWSADKAMAYTARATGLPWPVLAMSDSVREQFLAGWPEGSKPPIYRGPLFDGESG